METEREVDVSSTKYDDILLGILQNEEQIKPFLDVIFGFLYRRTDFYRIQDESKKIGFPVGVAERLIQQVFLKYFNAAKKDEEDRARKLKNVKIVENPMASVDKSTSETAPTKSPVEGDETELRKESENFSESFNGAAHDTYSWSQSITDLDVCVKVPKHIKRAKMVRVDLGNKHIKVEKQDDSDWEILIEGQLLHKINLEETTWTLVPGEHIHINFGKLEECWWDALLVDEPKIDVSQLTCTKPFSDLPDYDRAKIDELMFNEEQKRLNKPTTQQMLVQDVLREAWDKEGSPFKGSPFDPSLVNISGSTEGLLGLNTSSSS